MTRKDIIVLIALSILLTLCVWQLNEFGVFNSNPVILGDPEGDDTDLVILGEAVVKFNENFESKLAIHTGYVKYINNHITFQELLDIEEESLAEVLNFEFTALPNFLYPVAVSEKSSLRYYYQSNVQKDRTVIFRAEFQTKDSASVEVIYDGDYLKLVTLSDDNNFINGWGEDGLVFELPIGL